MPEIIDSLIISLSLDPKGFTEGQRRATESLRQMERGASASAEAIGAATAKAFQTHYAGINKQFAQANQHLEAIAAQARRSGSAVSAGSKEGASGLAALTTAGLAAYSALKSLQGLYREVTSTAASGAAIGRIGPEIGGSSHWIQSFANAAKTAVNADPNAIMEDLRTLSLDLDAWKHGIYNDRFTRMSMGGLYLSPNDTPEEAARKIEANLGGMSERDAAMRAQQYGLSRDFGRFGRLGPERTNAAMGAAQQRSLTQDQIDALNKLQQAENAVESAYTHLWQTITADLSKSGLAPALEGLASLEDAVSQNATASHALALGVGALEVAGGVTAVSVIGKLLGAIGRFTGIGTVLSPLGAIVAETWEFVAAVNALWAVPLMRFLVSTPGLAFLATMWPSSAGSAGEVGAEKRLFDQARRAAGAGGGSGGRLPGDAAYADVSAAGGPLGAGSLTGDPATDAALRSINSHESRRGDVWNFKHDQNPNYWTAGGYWQIIDSNWKQYARRAGVDLSQYPHAKGAPLTLQARVAGLMFHDSGFAPWDSAHGGSMTPDRITVAHRAMAAAAKAGADVAPPSLGDDQTMQRLFNYNQAHPGAMLNWSQLLALGNSGGSSRGIVNNNDIDHTTNIGSITVHTQATDGPGVAGALGGAISRNKLVNQANTGLE